MARAIWGGKVTCLSCRTEVEIPRRICRPCWRKVPVTFKRPILDLERGALQRTPDRARLMWVALCLAGCVIVRRKKRALLST